nr:MAG TPA_asm: hypothetical protein [Caudoviricetes sp.]
MVKGRCCFQRRRSFYLHYITALRKCQQPKTIFFKISVLLILSFF